MEKYYSASHTFPTVTTQSAVSTECVYEMCKYMIKHINVSIKSNIKDEHKIRNKVKSISK